MGQGLRRSDAATAVTDPHEPASGVRLCEKVTILLVIQRESQLPRNGSAGTIGSVHPNDYLSRFAKAREGGIDEGAGRSCCKTSTGPIGADPVSDLEAIRPVRRVKSSASDKLPRRRLEDAVFPGPVRIEGQLTV